MKFQKVIKEFVDSGKILELFEDILTTNSIFFSESSFKENIHISTKEGYDAAFKLWINSVSYLGVDEDEWLDFNFNGIVLLDKSLERELISKFNNFPNDKMQEKYSLLLFKKYERMKYSYENFERFTDKFYLNDDFEERDYGNADSDNGAGNIMVIFHWIECLYQNYFGNLEMVIKTYNSELDFKTEHSLYHKRYLAKKTIKEAENRLILIKNISKKTTDKNKLLALEEQKTIINKNLPALRKFSVEDYSFKIEDLSKDLLIENFSNSDENKKHIDEEINQFTWNANKVDLQELVFTLYKSGVLLSKKTNKPASRKELYAYFSLLFDKDINNDILGSKKFQLNTNGFNKDSFTKKLADFFDNYLKE